MIRYFFNMRRAGKLIADAEGALAASLDEARDMAISDARELIIGVLKTREAVPMVDGIEIADEQGIILRFVIFAEALGPAGAAP